MSDDIVERLRRPPSQSGFERSALRAEAAAEIERLRAAMLFAEEEIANGDMDEAWRILRVALRRQQA
jgi:hypothetical protein